MIFRARVKQVIYSMIEQHKNPIGTVTNKEGPYNTCNKLIVLAEHIASFRVAKNDAVTATVPNHIHAKFASESSA